MRTVVICFAASGVLVLALAGGAGGQPGDVEPGRQDGLELGRELYAEDCQSCHGPNGEGVSAQGPTLGVEGIRGEGPSLRGVGAASVDFYLRSGYMPLDDPDVPPRRSDPDYTPEQLRALIDHSTRLSSGGPEIPEVDPDAGSVSEGLELFAERCAGCHQVAGEGGLVLDGVAPELERATPTQVAEAIRIGPYLMPRFGERELDRAEVDSIAAYLEQAKDPRDAGGWGIGHVGPIPEGFIAWLLAGGALLALARVIGKRIE